jgi:hypothetical protein
MEKFVISSNGGGLGNRIKGLATILRLADKFDKTPLLHWPKNVLMGCDFSEIFDLSIKEISEKDVEKIKEDNWEFYRDWRDNINSNKKFQIFQCWRFLALPGEIEKKFAKTYPSLKGNNIDFEFERIPEKIKKSILSYLKRIKPKKNILKRVDNFLKGEDFGNIVGVHVRRTDFKNSPDGRGNISTNDLFFKRIEEILKKNPKKKFFLCTDSEETQNLFKKKFKEKIIHTKKKNWDMSSHEASLDSLADLLILSKTKHILGTYLSTFTEIAWWIGNCEAKVEIMGDEKVREKKKVLHNLNKENRGIKGLYKRIVILKDSLK